MYKIQSLISKGLQVEKLPIDIQEDINNLKVITSDFTVDDPDGHDYDEVIYEVIMSAHKDLLPGDTPAEIVAPEPEISAPSTPVIPEETGKEPAVPGEIAVRGENLLIGDRYFNENPEKVLGEQSIGGRFGDAIIVTGDKENLEIDVPVVNKVFIKLDKPVSTESKEKVIEKVNEVIKQRKADRAAKKKGKVKSISAQQAEKPEFYSFREVSDFYNKDISREEMEAYLYANPILPWEKYIDEHKFTKEELVENGFLFYERGQLIYKWQYLSGDINKKITFAKRDADIIKEQYGELVYQNQIESLQSNMPVQAHIQMSDEATDKIHLSPLSEFAKTFMLSSKEISFLSKDSADYEYTLNYFFVQYLRYLLSEEPEAFKGSDFGTVKKYVQEERITVIEAGGKASAAEKKAAEKANQNAKQKAKDVAERLFDRFLFEELFSEAKMKLEILWNEKYNAYKLPDLNKIPVGFSISKFIKDKYLKLNLTQRESVAFINYNRAGCIALEVGLGKTIAALASISQAVENNLAKKPLIVCPKNVYRQWRKETEGDIDDLTNQITVGVLHHYPKVMMLGNCNEENVIRNKEYTDDERDKINKAFDDIELVKLQAKEINKHQKINESLFIQAENRLSDYARAAGILTDAVISDKIEKLYTKYQKQLDKAAFNPDLYAKLNRQLEELIKKESAKRIPTFIRLYREQVKQMYSYLIYMTGKFKNTEDGTITLVTEEALKNNKIGCRNADLITNRMYTILSAGDDAESDESMLDKAKLKTKIQSRVEARLGNAKVALEDLGIDMIIIDEAHHGKKVFPSLIGNVIKDSEGKVKKTIKASKDGETVKTERETIPYSLGSGQTSGMAMSSFILSTYIQETTKTGNVILLTATPFENDPLEIYSMLTLANYPKLVEMGYDNMKDFFDTYMDINWNFKVKINGVEKATVLDGFRNLVQFRNIVRSIVLHRTGEQANIERPDKIIIPYVNRGLLPETVKEVKAMLLPNEEQRDFIAKIEQFIVGDVTLTQLQLDAAQKYIIQQAIEEQEALERDARKIESTKEETDDDEEKAEIVSGPDDESGDDDSPSEERIIDVTLQTESEQDGTRIIQAFSLMRQVTFSPFAIKLLRESHIKPTYMELIESSPKLQYVMACIKSVKEHHEKAGTEISGQIIYSVLGKQFFPLMKEYLVKEIGFKKEEVEIIDGDTSDKAKEDRKTAFYEGEIKILIATKSIQVGANLNKNATVLYHLFFDWNPTDNEQINGRIWRQGNRYGSVRIVYPMVENSMDSVVFQYLEEKTNRIKDVWDIAGVKSQLDLSDFDPNRLKLAALTEPRKKATFKIELEKEEILDEISLLQAKLDKVNEIPGIIKNFYYYLSEAVSKVVEFYNSLKSYRHNELEQKKNDDISILNTQREEIFTPVQELIDKKDDEIEKQEREIKVLDQSIQELDEAVKVKKDEIMAKISVAAIDGDDELTKKYRAEYKDVEKNFKASQEKEINKKIANVRKAITDIETSYDKKINALKKKLEEKLIAIDNKIKKIEETYNRDYIAVSEEFESKIEKSLDKSLHDSFAAYLTFMSYHSTYIIKWCQNPEAEGRLSNQMEPVFYSRDTFIGDLQQYKNYKGQYEKIKLTYLDPMGIAEEDAANLPMVIKQELLQKKAELEALDQRFAQLVDQYTIEYETRLRTAKPPAEEAKGFAMLNFLLDEMVELETPEPEEKIKVKKGEKPIETVPGESESDDYEYLQTKIEIFEMAFETITEDDERMFLETKIEIFKEALSTMAPAEMQHNAIKSFFARGGVIYLYRVIDDLTDTDKLMTPDEVIEFCNIRSGANDDDETDIIRDFEDAVTYCEVEGIAVTKEDASSQIFAKGGRVRKGASLSSYVDLVTEGLMSKAQFIKFMHKKGGRLMPSHVYDQIAMERSYVNMIEIFEENHII